MAERFIYGALINIYVLQAFGVNGVFDSNIIASHERNILLLYGREFNLLSDDVAAKVFETLRMTEGFLTHTFKGTAALNSKLFFANVPFGWELADWDQFAWGEAEFRKLFTTIHKMAGHAQVILVLLGSRPQLTEAERIVEEYFNLGYEYCYWHKTGGQLFILD